MEMDTFIFAVLQKIISIWILLTLYNDRVGTKQSAIARLEDADYDGHSLSMLQKIAGALNQKVEIKFSAIAS
jgi:predicted transcriptional regulator